MIGHAHFLHIIASWTYLPILHKFWLQILWYLWPMDSAETALVGLFQTKA